MPVSNHDVVSIDKLSALVNRIGIMTVTMIVETVVETGGTETATGTETGGGEVMCAAFPVEFM